MAGKTISFTIPRWTANLLPNVFGLLSLATVCVAVGLLTDYRWGMLAAGVIGTAVTWWVQSSAQPETAENVKPLKRAA